METTKEERDAARGSAQLGGSDLEGRLADDADLAEELLVLVEQFTDDTDYEAEDSIVDVHDPVGGRVSRHTLRKAREVIAKARTNPPSTR